MELKKDENNLILILSEKLQYNYDNDINGKKVKVDELKIENKETININDNVNVLKIKNREININEVLNHIKIKIMNMKKLNL